MGFQPLDEGVATQGRRSDSLQRGNRLERTGLIALALSPKQTAPDRMPRRGNRLALCGLASRQLAPDRIRTGDPHLTMVVLYRLSYKGVECVSRYHIATP